jgi:hypothetical protein
VWDRFERIRLTIYEEDTLEALDPQIQKTSMMVTEKQAHSNEDYDNTAHGGYHGIPKPFLSIYTNHDFRSISLYYRDDTPPALSVKRLSPCSFRQ